MFYPLFIRPLLFKMKPETIHGLIFGSGKLAQQIPPALSLISSINSQNNPALSQTIFDYPFNSPIGLAAGFDKNLELAAIVEAFGFGFMEAGSISAHSWPGNPRPRMFRVPQDKALINRMGLNNHGVEEVLPRILTLSKQWPVGINLVKTPDSSITEEAALQDFEKTFRSVYGLGAYVALNISCPNTEDGKTFEDPESLDALLKHIRIVEASCAQEVPLKPRPLLVKLSPDLSDSQLQEVFEIGLRHNISGWITTNTTRDRSRLKTKRAKIDAIGNGGLSGKPLLDPSTRVLSKLYTMAHTANRSDLIFIGVGGVMDAESAWEKITHGASLVQVYTGLVYQGPGLIRQIHKGLLQKLETYGYANIQQAIGSAVIDADLKAANHIPQSEALADLH